MGWSPAINVCICLSYNSRIEKFSNPKFVIFLVLFEFHSLLLLKRFDLIWKLSGICYVGHCQINFVALAWADQSFSNWDITQIIATVSVLSALAVPSVDCITLCSYKR